MAVQWLGVCAIHNESPTLATRTTKTRSRGLNVNQIYVRPICAGYTAAACRIRPGSKLLDPWGGAGHSTVRVVFREVR